MEYWYIPVSCIISFQHTEKSTLMLNRTSCFWLAPMGLADMMTPGESKLPIPLKPDGKEDGPPQFESKKVLPSPACDVGLAQQNSAILSFILWFELALFCSIPHALFHSHAIWFFYVVLFSSPHCVDLKVTSSYGIVTRGGKGTYGKPCGEIELRHWVRGGRGWVLPWYLQPFPLSSVIASCFGRFSSSILLLSCLIW